MQTVHRTKLLVVAATAAALLALTVPAKADDSGLRVSRGAAPSTLAGSNNLTGTGVGVGADGNGALNLNSAPGDQTTSTNFQSNRLTVPDALDRLGIRSDSKGKASLIYKFVNTKF